MCNKRTPIGSAYAVRADIIFKLTVQWHIIRTPHHWNINDIKIYVGIFFSPYHFAPIESISRYTLSDDDGDDERYGTNTKYAKPLLLFDRVSEHKNVPYFLLPSSFISYMLSICRIQFDVSDFSFVECTHSISYIVSFRICFFGLVVHFVRLMLWSIVDRSSAAGCSSPSNCFLCVLRFLTFVSCFTFLQRLLFMCDWR